MRLIRRLSLTLRKKFGMCSITGIVMAGGKSKRMGSDKGQLRFGGETLLARACGLLHACCHNVFISGEMEGDAPCPVIPDIFPGTGPLGGLYSVLKNIPAGKVLIIPVDLPLLNEKMLHFLIENHSDTFDATVFRTADGIQPLVAVYEKRILPLLEKQIQARSYKMQNFLQQIKVNFVQRPEFDPYFLNINTPGDWEKLQGYE